MVISALEAGLSIKQEHTAVSNEVRRRSTRLNEKKLRNTRAKATESTESELRAVENPEPGPIDSAVAQQGKRAVKRRKTNVKASTAPRRFPKKGRLKPFLEMPNEVICEVCVGYTLA